MRITAVAVGTRGDVNPLAELGSEMVKRGHDFRILAQEDFRTLIEKKNVTYLHLDGDADHVMKYLVTNYRTSLDFLTGLMKLKPAPDIMWIRHWSSSLQKGKSLYLLLLERQNPLHLQSFRCLLWKR